MGIQIHSSVIPRIEEALMEFMRIPDGAEAWPVEKQL